MMKGRAKRRRSTATLSIARPREKRTI
jgi:hypothetical protein